MFPAPPTPPEGALSGETTDTCTKIATINMRDYRILTILAKNDTPGSLILLSVMGKPRENGELSIEVFSNSVAFTEEGNIAEQVVSITPYAEVALTMVYEIYVMHLLTEEFTVAPAHYRIEYGKS